MTQYIEPNRKSDLTQATVRAWLSPMSSGILDGFEVTPGTSGFLINIASGRVVNRGTVIHDDLTRLNLNLIAHSAGSNEHHIVYASYTPAETFPPPAMVISVVTSSAASPSKPVSPNMPADSVKLADIFISGSATTWGSGTQIINAPKVAARGIDVTQTEVIADRLIQANANVMVSGGGGFDYSGGTLTWDQAIVITSSTVTSRESYFTAPIARLTVAAGSLAGVGANSLLFVVFDRRVPGAATTQPLRVLDLDNPDPVQRDLFFNANTRDQIVVIGAMTSGALSLRGGMGVTLPPSASEPPPRVLHNVPGGQPVWAPVDDTDMVGGMRVVADVDARTAIPSAQRKIGMIVLTQSDGAANVLTALPDTWSPLLTASGAIDNVDDSKIIGGLHVVADTDARDAIVSGKRKEGMVVYSQADERHFVLEGGVTNSDWKELGDDNRLVGGMRIISSLVAGAIPVSKQKIGALVYNLATSSLQQITAIADPPTLGAVRFANTRHAGVLDIRDLLSGPSNLMDFATFDQTAVLGSARSLGVVHKRTHARFGYNVGPVSIMDPIVADRPSAATVRFSIVGIIVSGTNAGQVYTQRAGFMFRNTAADSASGPVFTDHLYRSCGIIAPDVTHTLDGDIATAGMTMEMLPGNGFAADDIMHVVTDVSWQMLII